MLFQKMFNSQMISGLYEALFFCILNKDISTEDFPSYKKYYTNSRASPGSFLTKHDTLICILHNLKIRYVVKTTR